VRRSRSRCWRAAAKALSLYLRAGPPLNTRQRRKFVHVKMLFSPLSASSAVRHVLVKHANAAALIAPYVGSHMLRHSSAAR
jgi:site-specific recombinase XerD